MKVLIVLQSLSGRSKHLHTLHCYLFKQIYLSIFGPTLYFLDKLKINDPFVVVIDVFRKRAKMIIVVYFVFAVR